MLERSGANLDVEICSYVPEILQSLPLQSDSAPDSEQFAT